MHKIKTMRDEVERLYWRIGDVAERYHVAASLIRFWETEFEILKPRKNFKGNRQFTKEDIDQIGVIHLLVKTEGYTLKGAKRQLRLHYEKWLNDLHNANQNDKLFSQP